jgi:hypothetical protein
VKEMIKFIIQLKHQPLMFVLKENHWYLHAIDTTKEIKVRKGEIIELLDGLHELNNDMQSIIIDPIELILGTLI